MNKKNTDPSFFQVVFSAMAAAFGVQSRKNQARDFEKGKIGHYIVAGLVVTVIFITVVVVAVKFALANAAG